MATSKFGDWVKWATRERLLSNDLVDLSKTIMSNLMEFGGRIIGAHSIGSTHLQGTGCVLSGLKVQAQNPVSANVEVVTGRGLVYRPSLADLDSYNDVYPIIVETVQVVPIAANASGNPRIDLILAKPIAADAELETRDIFSTITKLFTATPNTVKRRRYAATVANGGIYVKQGTPGASPVWPAADANTMVLGAVTVDNGFVTIADAKIEDARLAPIGDWRHPKVHGTIVGATGLWSEIDASHTMVRRYGGANLVLDSHPAAGRYIFVPSGFTMRSDNKLWGTVHVTPFTGAAVTRRSATFQIGTPNIEINIFDAADAGVDNDFHITVEDVGLRGTGIV